MAAWAMAMKRWAIYGVVPPRPAKGATAAVAFSSQSVMTLAAAAAGIPMASHAPIIAVGNEWPIVCTIDGCMFLSMKSYGGAWAWTLREILAECLDVGLNCTEIGAGRSNLDCP